MKGRAVRPRRLFTLTCMTGLPAHILGVNQREVIQQVLPSKQVDDLLRSTRLWGHGATVK
jgi:hypothetical protein